MKKIFRNKISYGQKQNGATLVEFAIILPVFTLLVFGIIEFSLLLYNKGIITHAAREGARAGIVYTADARMSPSEIKAEVNKYIEDNLVSFSPANHDINVPNICPDGTSSGQELTVLVTYDYSFLVLPYFVPLQSEAVMICE